MRSDFWAIVWRVFKDRWVQLLIYSGISFFLVWMYVALFPIIRDQAEGLKVLLETYPESFTEAFNVDEAFLNTIGGFLSAEQYSLIWPIFVIVIASSLGGTAIAGEIEKGTIEVLLAQPISRLKLFFAKYFSGVIILAIFTFISVFSIVPLAAIHDIDYELINFSNFFIIALLFSLATYSIAMFFSSIFSQKGRVYFMTAGVIMLMYVANIVAVLKDNLTDLKYASYFNYFDSADVLVHNNIDDLAYWIFIGSIIVFTAAGALIFNRRDIAT